MISLNNNALTAAAPAPPVTPLTPISTSGTSGGLSFGDIVDALNPLQHIPVVSGLYRAASGNSISTTSQLAGDTMYSTLFGGVALGAAAIGFAASLTNVAVKQISGEDISQHIVATLGAVTGSGSSSSGVPVVSGLVPNASQASAANAYASLGNINAVISSNTASVATPLVASNAVAAATLPTTPSVATQADTAVQGILHQGAHPEISAAQYQRAQILDAANKKLVKMAV